MMFVHYIHWILIPSYLPLQWVGSIDLNANEQADANIIVDKDAGWVEQEGSILKELQSILDTQQLDAVICVAGMWCESVWGYP